MKAKNGKNEIIKTNFNFNKSSSAWRILLLSDLGRTDDGTITLREILKRFNFKSRNALYYYEKKFLAQELLIKTGIYPTKYRLSKLAKEIIKKILQPSDRATTKDVWRFHHYIRGYKILKWGNFKFDNFRSVPMNNWSYVRFPVKIEQNDIVVHILDTETIKVYCPTIYGTDHSQIKEKAVILCNKVIQNIVDRFDMKVEAGYDVRAEHYAVVDSQKLAKLLINVKDPRFWVDFSLGTEELETKEPEHIQNVLDMPRAITEMRDTLFNDLTPAIRDLSVNIKLHLSIMQDIKEHLAKQTSIFEQIKGVLK